MPSTTAGVLSAADLADFRARFGESAGLAIVALDGSAAQFVGDSRTPYAWSTSKVLVVATLLREVGAVSALTDEQRELVTAALSASDNESAALLMAEIEDRRGGFDAGLAALTDVLRTVGDTTTTASATDDYSTGETVWPLSAQAEFVAQLRRGCLLDPTSRDYLFAEMAGVIEEQQWGLGEVGSPAYKGGWDVDDDDLLYVRQVGVLRTPDGVEYVVGLSARTPIAAPTAPASPDPTADFDQEWADVGDAWVSDDGEDISFASSEQLAGDVARWVVEHVTSAPTPKPC